MLKRAIWKSGGSQVQLPVTLLTGSKEVLAAALALHALSTHYMHLNT